MVSSDTFYGENTWITLGNVAFVILAIVTVITENIMMLLWGSVLVFSILFFSYYAARLHLYTTIGGLTYLNTRIIFSDLHVQDEVVGVIDYIEIAIDAPVKLEDWTDWKNFRRKLLYEMKQTDIFDNEDTPELVQEKQMVLLTGGKKKSKRTKFSDMTDYKEGESNV